MIQDTGRNCNTGVTRCFVNWKAEVLLAIPFVQLSIRSNIFSIQYILHSIFAFMFSVDGEVPVYEQESFGYPHEVCNILSFFELIIVILFVL